MFYFYELNQKKQEPSTALVYFKCITVNLDKSSFTVIHSTSEKILHVATQLITEKQTEVSKVSLGTVCDCRLKEECVALKQTRTHNKVVSFRLTKTLILEHRFPTPMDHYCLLKNLYQSIKRN